MSRIKVAIDSGPLVSGHKVRGIGVMVQEQIDAVNGLKNSGVKLDSFDFSSKSGIRKLQNGNYDVVHYTTFFPFSITLPPRRYGKRQVVTIQDLIHLIYPKKYPPGIRGNLNLLRQKIRLKNIDAVVTISETSKKDIVRLLGMPSEKVHVVYLVPSPQFKPVKNKKIIARVRKKYKLPKKFVFNLGDINYNKNISTLIDACKIANLPLVIGGKRAKSIDDLGLLTLMGISGPKDWVRFLFNLPHPENAHYESLLKRFKANKKIIRPGFIPDEDVGVVMSLATVYVQPSYYEGFGLSVPHAFACNVPVVISKTNCLVEVAGGAALVADTNDPKDFAKKILKLSKNKKMRDKFIGLGSERIKFFTYKKMALELVEVYKSIS